MMMNCQKISGFLSDYLDSALPPRVAGEIAQHLRACDHCRSEYEELSKVVMAVSRFENRRLSPGFDARLMRRLQEETSQGARRRHHAGGILAWPLRPPARWMATAGAVAAAALAGWQLYPAPQAAASPYLSACVQAHESFRVKPQTHASNVLDAAPDVDLADESQY